MYKKGPNPSPDITDLRGWDLDILLKIYTPEYPKPFRNCHLCGLGPCGFAGVDYGKCGMDKESLKAREVLLHAVIGASGHASFARRLLDDLILRYGGNCPVDMGEWVRIKTPLITLICGGTPETLKDMENALCYIERNLTHLLSSVNYGTETSMEDFISKALHAGMLDSLALEVADISQISALNLPKGISDSPLIQIGLDGDKKKPFILIIGHNSVIGSEIVHLLDERKLNIEVGALCCAASDLSRHYQRTKMMGNQADQIEVIRSGIADVVILDTQCIHADVIKEARNAGSLVIATSRETSLGLKDLTGLSVKIISGIVSSEGSGIIFDKKKAAEVSINSAISRFRKKDKISYRSDSNSGVRIGRGPVRDSEIRGIAPSIVMGEIPGIVGLFGCPEDKQSDVYKIAEKLLQKGYIVATGGCSSIDIAKAGDIFKQYRDTFDSGNLINLGSCVSASHLLGACIKIASVVSHRPIEGNYIEIADYILNRVGAVLVLWGAFTDKAFASTLGAVRLGIPVILGPRGIGYSIHLSGKKESSVFDARLGDRMNTTPYPSHLISSAKNIDEGIPLIARLCIRHSDTTEGRKIKLKNYIEYYRNTRGGFPEELPALIRTGYDIPEGMEEEIKHLLTNWSPGWIPDPTLLSDKVRIRTHGSHKSV
jgi:CO dehydrogenase/acetyl-CoA synthase alpha subunit